MSCSDYESLLLNYFDHDLQHCSEDDINLFVASTIAWLSIGPHTVEPTAAALQILEKIAQTTGALRKRRGRSHCAGCMNSDSDWLEALSYDFRWREGRFWNLYRPTARRIFHYFEALYHQGVLSGDLNDISTNLHICLEKSHEEVEACEVEGCKWAFHTSQEQTGCWSLDEPIRDTDDVKLVSAASVSEKEITLDHCSIQLSPSPISSSGSSLRSSGTKVHGPRNHTSGPPHACLFVDNIN